MQSAYHLLTLPFNCATITWLYYHYIISCVLFPGGGRCAGGEQLHGWHQPGGDQRAAGGDEAAGVQRSGVPLHQETDLEPGRRKSRTQPWKVPPFANQCSKVWSSIRLEQAFEHLRLLWLPRSLWRILAFSIPSWVELSDHLYPSSCDRLCWRVFCWHLSLNYQRGSASRWTRPPWRSGELRDPHEGILKIMIPFFPFRYRFPFLNLNIGRYRVYTDTETSIVTTNCIVLIEGLSYDDSNVLTVHLLSTNVFFNTRSFAFIIYDYYNTFVFL